ncbi:MAG: bifunctional uroporphyrinogen-III C-methylase/synthase [Solirubrobacterales bacterium]
MSARPGVVYLVGAGPGDPGLITARALELIGSADVIFHDRLIPPGVLDGARPDAELAYVGKVPAERPSTAGRVPPGGGSAGPSEGKRADQPNDADGPAPPSSVPQGEINARLVEAARAGRSVVRLKGGDPFVFGRGGEEAEALREAGVEFEVVPGVTAGIAASAYAGIPVTHRDDASAVAFVTGHERADAAAADRAGAAGGAGEPEDAAGEGVGPGVDWEALARFPGTLVFYMGVRRLGENARALIEAGRDPEEPAAAVERGTMEGQRTVVATLRTLAEAVKLEDIGAPALIVVGPVVGRREALAWLERRPLHGRRVVVTRARAQASGLAATLRTLGAEAVELPAIRIEPRIESEEVRRAVARIGEYALICVTSPNGAQLLFDALATAGLDARALDPAPTKLKKKQVEEVEGSGSTVEGSAQAATGAGAEDTTQAGTAVAAIGPGTARALAEHGIAADVVPERFVAEALVEALAPVEVEGRRVLIARAAEARDVLPDALRERGAEVDVVALYETVREEPAPEAVEAVQGADYVTFTSSSTVTNLTEALGERFPREARIVSIGPITSEAVRAAGLEAHVEAKQHDVDGLIAALLADAAR